MLLNKHVIVALPLLLSTGCASIVSSPQRAVTISSLPDRADFVVVDQKGKTVNAGQTPATITLKSDAGYFKGEKYTVKFQKEGFGVQNAPLDAELNGWYWGNILFGWGVGMLVVDPLTGAMWTLPKSKSVVLVPR